MKHFILMLAICIPGFLFAQQHTLEKLWQTDTIIAVPESILPDYKKNILYVSLIDGGGWDADGKGGVGILSMDGKKYNATWITGLNAPKGLGRFGNRLYAADISEVIVIDIQKGKIEKKLAIEGAKGLNDITVDEKGIVYVSDSKTGKIHRIENDIATVYLENQKGANGLKAIGSNLYILNSSSLVKADAQKNLQTVSELGFGGDGIEPVGNGDFIVTAWAGIIYYVYADGRKELLLDTRQEKRNTADIAYDPSKHILYVPTFNGKLVAAYLLK